MPIDKFSYIATSREVGAAAQLLEFYLCFVRCLLSVAAFYLGRILSSWWTTWKKPREESAGVTAVLLLFQHLPDLPDVLQELETHIPEILGTNAWHVPCCCDVNTRVFVDLVLPEWIGPDRSVNSDAAEAACQENRGNTNMGSIEGTVVRPTSLKSDNVQKPKRKGRLRFLTWRYRQMFSRSVTQSVSQSSNFAVSPESKLSMECENDPSDLSNGINASKKNPASKGIKVASTSTFPWERLVEQKAMRLLSEASTMRNCHTWDVHYIKVPSILYRQDDDDDDKDEEGDQEKEYNNSEICSNPRGGILLRMKPHSMMPFKALKLAVKSGLLVSTIENKESDGNFSPWSTISNVIRELAQMFLLHDRHSQSMTPQENWKWNRFVPSKNLVLLPPHSQEIPLRIAAELNTWIDESIVTLADVESVLLERTVDRLTSRIIFDEFDADAVIARIIRTATSRIAGRAKEENGMDIGTVKLCGKRVQAVYAVSPPGAAQSFTAVQCERVVCPSIWLPKSVSNGASEMQMREVEQHFMEALGNLEETVLGVRRADSVTEMNSSF